MEPFEDPPPPGISTRGGEAGLVWKLHLAGCTPALKNTKKAPAFLCRRSILRLGMEVEVSLWEN